MVAPSLLNDNDKLSPKDRERIANFVDKHAGIQLPESKHALVETRLSRRKRALGFATFREYIDYVLNDKNGEEERLFLLDAITTNKTDFYREPDHFDFLRGHIMTGYTDKTLSSPLYRVWSAGCSSGEEPYTLAIELSEVKRQREHFQFAIEATDISLSSLKTAQKGVYPHHRIEPVPLALRKRYFLRSKNKTNDRVMMSNELKAKVEFTFFNLLTGNYAPKQNAFNAIFCRNVMIYFDNEDRSLLTQRYADSLCANGLLFIGHAETLIDKLGQFKRVQPTIYQKVG